MKVKVDSEKCQGHNRCYALAPGLFKVDELGYATARGDGTVPPDMREKAKLAVENGAKSIPLEAWTDFRFQEDALKQIGRVAE